MEGMTTPWAGDAMDTLKMKIGLLTKEGKESTAKMEAAEAVGDPQQGHWHSHSTSLDIAYETGR